MDDVKGKADPVEKVLRAIIKHKLRPETALKIWITGKKVYEPGMGQSTWKPKLAEALAGEVEIDNHTLFVEAVHKLLS